MQRQKKNCLRKSDSCIDPLGCPIDHAESKSMSQACAETSSCQGKSDSLLAVHRLNWTWTSWPLTWSSEGVWPYGHDY